FVPELKQCARKERTEVVARDVRRRELDHAYVDALATRELVGDPTDRGGNASDPLWVGDQIQETHRQRPSRSTSSSATSAGGMLPSGADEPDAAGRGRPVTSSQGDRRQSPRRCLRIRAGARGEGTATRSRDRSPARLDSPALESRRRSPS